MQETHDKQIETPDGTVANYVYKDHIGNPIYYDGALYWVVMPDGKIEMYG